MNHLTEISEKHQTQKDFDDDHDFYNDIESSELKANPVYRKLTETMLKLIHLRAVTIQKAEHIFKLIQSLKTDPDLFIDNLMQGRIEIPCDSSIPVPEVPEIDFSKYEFPKNDSNGDEIVIQQLVSKYLIKEIEPPQTEDEDDSKKLVVRGREYNENKPQTFNQLWTAEEQLRLEELLVKYPPERKESRRWVKIAAALGNRTPQQVCSRVQKYFLKLRKMGFTVPGRNPRSSHQKNKGRPMKKNHINKNTTFFPKIENAQCSTKSTSAVEENLEEALSADEQETREKECYTKSEMAEADWLTDSKRLEIFLRIKSDKENKRQVIRHFNTTCSNCGESPIADTRWTCSECSTVDFCSDCVAHMLRRGVRLANHPVSHELEPVTSFDSVRDPDYFPHNFNSASYLDPNFKNN
ncbi:hypothetical protein LSTR_LSTR002158 [Laodelphax striatellus]|uniref:ZZ-type zinc finger-containing protein 3 n=1 Tax=Laodelphax striatellus TaxID=195883 RepID=A0A482XQA5_LAOST|nr:hypothetical protein LSTR_LSTR002158 [Laodelphax striatellus]